MSSAAYSIWDTLKHAVNVSLNIKQTIGLKNTFTSCFIHERKQNYFFSYKNIIKVEVQPHVIIQSHKQGIKPHNTDTGYIFAD